MPPPLRNKPLTPAERMARHRAVVAEGKTAPPELGDDARREWQRVMMALKEAGTFTNMDRGILTAYCQAYGRWAQAERTLAQMAKNDPVTGALMIKTPSGRAVTNPLVIVAGRAAADMAKFAAELGMTPTSRVRPPKEEGPKLGKKELAIQEAMRAHEDSGWGEVLAPLGKPN